MEQQLRPRSLHILFDNVSFSYDSEYTVLNSLSLQIPKGSITGLIGASGAGKTTLFDFGLSVPNKPAFLRPGNRTGTPNYMAPEVIRRRQSDHRLDIFSFGVTAYEICSGTLPWPGGDARAALAHDTPARDIRELDNDIPDRLAEAIMDCLKPDPENRHDTMEDFLRKIARLK